MLLDFLLLEIYYDAPETCRFYEELSKRYGISALCSAMHAGYICGSRIKCGPDRGRWVFRLTEQGRKEVLPLS